MRLLLIEDDNTTVESVRLCLEIYEPKSQIIATGKGLEALRLMQAEHFDAVLIDLGLPDIDGIEVIERLRTFSQVPAVVLSARHSPDVIAKALTLGADDYITKPFDYRLLLKRLHNLVEKTSSENPPTMA
jgi:two-component system, OmpR family, KDP operon response regulator KdpE